MEMYFGVGGELLTPLDEMLDGDIKLSFEVDLEMKDPLSTSFGADDWDGWGSLRSSPTLDIFGDKEACIMVSPETVMPFIKREIKQEPPPQVHIKEEPEEEESYITGGLDIKQEQDNEYYEEESTEGPAEEEEEEEEDEDSDEEEDDEEEQQVQIKIEPKETSLWTSVLTKPTIVRTESPVVTYPGRKKAEIVVAKSPSTVTHHQTLKVLHATKKTVPESSPSPRSLVIKRVKDSEGYPKPAYSYSCLIAMALKNSVTGSLPVSEIYNFMCEHFPYFKSAPTGWKNSVRHNLSLNKCFEKIEKGGGGGGCRKGCLWAMNPAKVAKMDEEVAKWSKKDPTAIRRSMKHPDELERLERGDLKIGARRESYDSGAEDDSDNSSSSSSSDSDTEEVPPSLKRFDSRLSSQESNDLGLPDEMYEELGILEEVMSSDNEAQPGPEVKRMRLSLESFQRQPVRPV